MVRSSLPLLPTRHSPDEPQRGTEWKRTALLRFVISLEDPQVKYGMSTNGTQMPVKEPAQRHARRRRDDRLYRSVFVANPTIAQSLRVPRIVGCRKQNCNSFLALYHSGQTYTSTHRGSRARTNRVPSVLTSPRHRRRLPRRNALKRYRISPRERATMSGFDTLRPYRYPNYLHQI